MVSIPLQYSLSQQESPGCYMEPKALLVHHSNVLKPRTVHQFTQPRWFYLLVIESSALIFHSSFLSTQLLAGYRRDRTSTHCHVLLPNLIHHDFETWSLIIFYLTRVFTSDTQLLSSPNGTAWFSRPQEKAWVRPDAVSTKTKAYLELFTPWEAGQYDEGASLVGNSNGWPHTFLSVALDIV